MPELLSNVSGPIDRFTADGAYDTTAVYELLTNKGAEVVVPPIRNAQLSKSDTVGTRARYANVESTRALGRRKWKKQSGYHQQARVENTFYRWKKTIGGELRSRTTTSQAGEIAIAVNVLNRILDLGAPRSEAIRK